MRYGLMMEEKEVDRLLAAGETVTTIARLLEMPYTAALRIAHRKGYKLKRGRPQNSNGSSPKYAERNEEMKRRYLAGETLQEIGDDYGITRERVRQILDGRGVSFSEIREDLTEIRFLDSLKENELAAVGEYKGSGESVAAVAKRHGMPHQRLSAILRRLGIPRHPVRKDPDHWAKVATVKKMYGDGARIRDIANAIGLSCTEHVYNYLQDAGVKAGRMTSIESRADEVLDLVNNTDMTQREIAKHIGCSQGGLQHFLRRHAHETEAQNG